MTALTVLPVPGLPEIEEDTDIGAVVVAALAGEGDWLREGDIVVVTSKIVSKATGLAAANEDRQALVLRESHRVVTERATGGGITRVVASKAGPVLAGAGIDASNTGSDRLLLLPHDPDASARDILGQLCRASGQQRLGVILSDTAGRPWRGGLTDFALGLAGVRGQDDLRGRDDTDGRPMAVTVRCLADEIAAAADLVKGKLDGVPVAVVRGLAELVERGASSTAREIVRSGRDDWFGLGRVEAIRDALGIPAGSPESESCGIQSVHSEPLADRVRRAVRVALSDPHGRGIGAVSDDDSTLTLRCEDPVVLGRAWARLEVALASELLQAESDARVDPAAGEVVLRVRPRPE